MMQDNRETNNGMKDYGGNSNKMGRERNDGWEGEENGGINGERYEEWYYGHGHGGKEEAVKKTATNRYRQKKISGYQARMAQQMAQYGTEVQEFMKGEKAGKSWEDIKSRVEGGTAGNAEEGRWRLEAENYSY
jgi:hypothetical protein